MNRIVFLLALAGAALGIGGLSASAQAPLTITEFMAANARTLADENGDYPDWIEIHNAGAAIDLQGWALTDSTNTLMKWVFPPTSLGAGQYLVVFASGKNRTNATQRLHTNFSLDANGEYLALVDPEGEVVTEFAPQFPVQRPDVSYGVRNGRNYYFPTPTPGAANVDGVNDFVADTKFSHDRGFYEQPFDLEITTATSGATIYYTTNGVAPSATNLTAAGVLRYGGPIRIAGTTVLRAAAFLDGLEPSNVDTHSYLFLDDVIRQSPTGAPPPGWPVSWSPNTRDYGMDPDVVNNPAYRDTIKNDLQTLPSFCLVMDLPDLFGTKGIYSNASNDGRPWERKGSVELVYPDGSKGFQIDCGVRVRGGFSRSTDNPKHAFRFFFREQYGASKLKYPLFGDDGADSFDGIDLRTFQNYSWSFQGDGRGVFIRDQFSRDTQLDMGHLAERGNYYHLYINGQYWGLFNTCERPEASYGETYIGGNKDDYDVIKVSPDNGYTIGATDGNMQAWTRLYNACKAGLTNDAAYEKLRGNNPDGTRNPDYEVLVDVDNLIDYMLVILYGGNLDAPISWFLGENSPNNWYGMRNRTGQFGGFRFFAHDAEHTLLNVNESRIGPFPAGNSSVTASNPQWIWQKMWANAEFRLYCADRVQAHFFNDGALTPPAAIDRFMRRASQIERAVVGESARWGDSKRNPPFTRTDWLNEVNNIVRNYMPNRSGVVLNQLRSKKLYPDVVAPVFSQHGGAVAAGYGLTISVPAGSILYTRDGTDPRLRGGAVSPTALTYSDPVSLGESTPVRARALVGTNWSALNEAMFTLVQTYTNVLFTEIMYRPVGTNGIDGDQFEFLELKNANAFAIDLGGVRFTNGIRFTFPLGTKLEPGRFAVLARDPANFARRYPNVPLAGLYTGNLANAGERITLVRATGEPLVSVLFKDTPPWPVAADGQGFSLVPRDPNRNPAPDDAANWRASSRIDGSPGADDAPLDTVPVVINEILTHTDPPQLDFIELHNPTDQTAEVGGWYLTDDHTQPRKFRLPAGRTIPARGYLVFNETDFNPQPGHEPSFTLSSHGEEVFLFSANAADELTGYIDGTTFGAAANGVAFGRFTNSVGEVQFPAMGALTPGGPNAAPRVGPVVINEIHYHPPAGEAEFIELKNLSAAAVPLYDLEHPGNGWRVEGTGFSFPAGAEIPARGLALLVASDPAGFRARHAILPGVPVFGPFPGTLQNSGELIELQRPDRPDLVTNTLGEVSLFVPFITVDAVRYNDKTPWPTNAAGLGASLERLPAGTFGNDPAHWRASFGQASPGLENDGNRRPTVNAGVDQEATAIGFPAVVTLGGTANDDGLPLGRGLKFAWTQLSGAGHVVFGDAGQPATTVALPGGGEYILQLTVSDGELSASDDIAIRLTRPTGPQTIVAAGADWRYLDDGSDQGEAWRATTFDDSTWKQGPAQLGYGDGDERTTLGYGSDGNNKYVTAYFRKRFQATGAAAISSATLRVLRDDGVVVYLNGKEILRDNMPEGAIEFRTYASGTVSGAEETTAFIEFAIDASLLREGGNILAAEVHQVNRTSTDLSFDLALEVMAFPQDQPPSVNAGADLSVVLPASAALQGTVSDDGLPIPPGFLSCTWTQVSGPGAVSFADTNAWATTASFAQPGEFVLRLTVNDGGRSTSDEVRVTVTGHTAPQWATMELVDGDVLAVRMGFVAEPGTRYVMQTRGSLTEGNWLTLQEVAPGAGGRVELTEPVDPGQAARFYRIAIP